VALAVWRLVASTSIHQVYCIRVLENKRATRLLRRCCCRWRVVSAMRNLNKRCVALADSVHQSRAIWRLFYRWKTYCIQQWLTNYRVHLCIQNRNRNRAQRVLHSWFHHTRWCRRLRQLSGLFAARKRSQRLEVCLIDQWAGGVAS
jgi:hypothetical protein